MSHVDAVTSMHLQGPAPKPARRSGHSPLRVIGRKIVRQKDPTSEDTKIVDWLEDRARAGTLSLATNSILHFTTVDVNRDRSGVINFRKAAKEAMKYDASHRG